MRGLRDRRAARRPAPRGPRGDRRAPPAGRLRLLPEFVFALPAAALLACAVYALLRSEGMQRTALGARLRGRHRADAACTDDDGRLRPGIAGRRADGAPSCGPGGQLATGRAQHGRAALAAFAVAATWYWRNLDSVDRIPDRLRIRRRSSANFGKPPTQFLLGLVARRGHADRRFRPAGSARCGLVLVGLVAVAVAAVSRIWDASDRRGAALLVSCESDAASVGHRLRAGYLALSTSRNGGSRIHSADHRPPGSAGGDRAETASARSGPGHLAPRRDRPGQRLGQLECFRRPLQTADHRGSRARLDHWIDGVTTGRGSTSARRSPVPKPLRRARPSLAEGQRCVDRGTSSNDSERSLSPALRLAEPDHQHQLGEPRALGGLPRNSDSPDAALPEGRQRARRVPSAPQ